MGGWHSQEQWETPASPGIPREGIKVHGAASVVVLAGCHGDRHIFAEDPLGSLMGYVGRGLRYAFFAGDPTLS